MEEKKNRYEFEEKKKSISMCNIRKPEMIEPYTLSALPKNRRLANR